MGAAPAFGLPFVRDSLYLSAFLSADDKYTLMYTPPMATHRLPPRTVTPNPRDTVVLTNLAGPLLTMLGSPSIDFPA